MVVITVEVLFIRLDKKNLNLIKKYMKTDF